MSNVVSMASRKQVIPKIPHPVAGFMGGKQVQLFDAAGNIIAETRVVLRQNKLPKSEEDRLLLLILNVEGAVTARFLERGKVHVIGNQPQKN